MSCEAPLAVPPASASAGPVPNDSVPNDAEAAVPSAASAASAASTPAPAADEVAVPATQVLTEHVHAWRDVSLAPHRYQAVAFHLGDKEIGHLHATGLLDVPFPRPMRDVLVRQGAARPHRYVPESGWVTLRVANGPDVDRAAYLLRLSYLYRRIVRARTPGALARVRADLDRLDLDADLRALFDAVLDRRADTTPAAAPPHAATPRAAAPHAE